MRKRDGLAENEVGSSADAHLPKENLQNRE
jgi:hypothetical protein